MTTADPNIQARIDADRQRRYNESQAGQAVADAWSAWQNGYWFHEAQLDAGRHDAELMTGSGATRSRHEHAVNPDGQRSFRMYALGQIVAMGWRLIDTTYLYVPIGETSRDKFISSGQNSAAMGKLVACHLFERPRGAQTKENDYR